MAQKCGPVSCWTLSESNWFSNCEVKGQGYWGRKKGRPHIASAISTAEPFSRGTGTLRCLQEEMATYRHWFVSLWRDPDDVPHCRILSSDKTEWRLISATLCGWRRCFVADQLWLMTRIREEEELDYTFDCAPLVIEISIIALKTNTYLCECDYDHIHVFSKFLVQDWMHRPASQPTRCCWIPLTFQQVLVILINIHEAISVYSNFNFRCIYIWLVLLLTLTAKLVCNFSIVIYT